MPVVLEELSGNPLPIAFVDNCKFKVTVAAIIGPSAAVLLAAETYNCYVSSFVRLFERSEVYLDRVILS